jgi:hypothetical protein
MPAGVGETNYLATRAGLCAGCRRTPEEQRLGRSLKAMMYDSTEGVPAQSLMKEQFGQFQSF